MTKDDLYLAGIEHITKWCEANGVQVPRVVARSGKPDFGVCAYYRNGEIQIWPSSCAGLGLAGRQWSWPGYSTDRTPYGVLAHELGHHVDNQHGPRGGYRSHVWRPLDAKPLTGYCPNDNEWFAELFRLFVTNPDLFRALRPKIEGLFFGDWPVRAEARSWREVLAGSSRHIAVIEKRVAA